MGRRTLLLVVSVLLAAVGVALIGLYVKGANQRAESNVRTVEVLVVKDRISGGTLLTAEQNSAFQDQSATPAMASGAITNLSQLNGKYAAATLFPGTIMRPSMLTADSAAGAVHSDIHKLGFTFDFQSANRAFGLLDPGDQVSVWSGSKTRPAEELIESVRVISVGLRRNVSSSSDDQVPTTTVGLDATADQVAAIIDANDDGDSLYLAVIGAGGPSKPSARPTTKGL